MAKDNGFRERLLAALKAKELTQAGLAEKLDLSESAVSQWVSGKKRPGRANMVLISGLLDVRAGWLEFGEGEGPKEDLSKQRSQYIEKSAWNFRPQPVDGGREYGNANVWSIPWDISALVREAIQNSLDAANEPDLGIDVEFSIIRLENDSLEGFLSAIKWMDGDGYIGLHSHVSAAAMIKQKLGNLLKDGLNHFEQTKELILLRIDDFGTRGLTGDEFGQSHFAAFCRNNLDSRKTSEFAGGSYGLGKSVFWKASRFATVFVNSHLNESYFENGRSLKYGRMIGKSDLAWHEIKGNMYSGPGWFGATDSVNGDTRSLSIWDNQALANDLYLAREKNEMGASILVMGFHDANSDDPDNVERMADKIERAVAVNFWPAIVSGRMVARVRTLEGDEERRSMPVDPEKYEPEFVDAYKKYQRGELVDSLSMEGDVVQRYVPLSIPRRTAMPKHPELDHEAVLLVRLDKKRSG